MEHIVEKIVGSNVRVWIYVKKTFRSFSKESRSDGK